MGIDRSPRETEAAAACRALSESGCPAGSPVPSQLPGVADITCLAGLGRKGDWIAMAERRNQTQGGEGRQKPARKPLPDGSRKACLGRVGWGRGQGT